MEINAALLLLSAALAAWFFGYYRARHTPSGQSQRTLLAAMAEFRSEDQTQQQSEAQRLAEAQQIAKVGSWNCDLTTDKLSGSDELCRIFGLDQGGYHGTFDSIFAYVHPEDRDSARHVIQLAYQSLQPFHFEHRVIWPNGEVRLIEARGRVFVGQDGAPVRISGTAHDITERQAAEEHMRRLAHYDSLTGLPNRRLFYESLGRELGVVRNQAWTVALLYVDLDRFKYINDTFGHVIGDELLRQVAERILSCTRVRDTVGRLGGDEFGVIAISKDGPDGAAALAEHIISKVQQPFVLLDHEVAVTPSIGIAICPTDSCETEALIRFADMAMYHAKSAGRNTYRFYTPLMNARAREKLELEIGLRAAIDRGEFILHYQPEVDIESGEWTGAEALLRWNRPEHGLVPAASFLPTLEGSGLIVPVGRWIIDAACRQLGEWRNSEIGGVGISVNVSVKQLTLAAHRREVDDASDTASFVCEADEICGYVEKCLAMHHVPRGSLTLELTETALMSHAVGTVELLARLKKLGVNILVDNFGTGYSSLSCLRQFPIDILKIDRAFISQLSSDPEDRAIARAIISLAHSLNLKVIAEGVETREQLECLQDEHCDQAQGYYIAHPMPAPELLKLFQAKSYVPGRYFNKPKRSLPPGSSGSQRKLT
jgi:diguanylate cyclase (GGDEF)-like protein/PAS domain S-box-containing protein